MARVRVAVMAAVIALILPLSGCQYGFGSRPGSFDPAQGPAGISAQLRVGSGFVHGEVLEVREAELLLLADSPPRVVRVPLEVIRIGRFHDVRDHIVRGEFPSAEQRERIRRLSRFPAGVSEEVLAALLDAYGQREPEVVR